MGYRNQAIIQDFYGDKARSKAFDQATTALTGVAKSMADSQKEMRAIAKKDELQFGMLLGKSHIAQNEILQGLRDKKIIGDATLTQQALDAIQAAMEGPNGSINADAMIKSGKLNTEQRDEYQKSINKVQKMMNNFTGDSALMLTDQKLYESYDKNTMFYQGDTAYERRLMNLAANSTYNTEQGEGIVQTGRSLKDRVVKYTYEIDENNEAFKDLTEFSKIKSIEKDGKMVKVIEWERNLSTWNGDYIGEQTIENTDWEAQGLTLGAIKKVGSGFELNDNYRAVLNPTLSKGADNSEVTTTDTFADVNKFKLAYEDIIKLKLDEIETALTTPGSMDEGNNFVTSSEHLQLGGLNLAAEFASGDEKRINIAREVIRAGIERKLTTKYGLNEGDVTNGLKLTKRKITQAEIDQLIEREIEGADQLVADSEQYFYRKETSKIAGSESAAAIRNAKQSALFYSATDLSAVLGSGQTNTPSVGDKSLVYNAATKLWVPMTAIKLNVPGEVDADGNKGASIQTIRFQPYTGKDVAGLNEKIDYNNWLGY